MGKANRLWLRARKEKTGPAPALLTSDLPWRAAWFLLVLSNARCQDSKVLRNNHNTPAIVN